MLRNPELVAVLQRIANEGPSALLQGDVARAITAKVQGHPSNPGTLTERDLATYQPIVREPLCFDYRVRGMPPPSSGALAIGQILGLLHNTPAASLPLAQGLPTADWLHLYTEASRLADEVGKAQPVVGPLLREVVEPHLVLRREHDAGQIAFSKVDALVAHEGLGLARDTTVRSAHKAKLPTLVPPHT